MRSFKRTSSGLNNQHKFYGVDIIVFLEGGSTSFSKEQVYSGKYSSETEDIIFWKNIFNIFNSQKKIKFKSIGSKSTIKEIALDIIDGKLTTVMVAMDNEFDEVLNKRLNSQNIFYTNGYSWENDIWKENIIKSVIEELSAVQITNNDIENNFKEFLKNIKTAVFADAYLFKDDLSFFPRKTGYLFCVECNPTDLPFIKTETIEQRIIDKGITKRKATLYGNKKSIDTLKFCFGHFLADYCCQLIIHYLKNRHGLKNLSKDFIYRMGIKKFFDLEFSTSSLYSYYESQFTKNGV